jgi:hypothetical protein
MTMELLDFALILATLIALGLNPPLFAVFKELLARGGTVPGQLPKFLRFLVVLASLFPPLGSVLSPLLKAPAHLFGAIASVSSVGAKGLLAPGAALLEPPLPKHLMYFAHTIVSASGSIT